ncbi:DinB family protein [Micromonospora sp. WMMD1102]|uniref:DinB family protein n=1 Tax=Micromonospora sp. WMMD1102 TaxID=3016105 RepID=UPI002414E6EC|nr:DinB family protein [Micromonospora sp. WMMD1102]MDG4786044.1 DinB family protein [Micromonospora sp. WMMD1102]
MATTIESTLTGERADLLDALGKARFFLRFTARELDDEQAATRSTASELCVGGLVKHVAAMERQWARFIVDGPSGMPAGDDPAAYEQHAASFRMLPGETLAGILAEYEEIARRTDELVRTLPDLDAGHELPPAPWFTPGTRWSARRVIQHVIGETAQHAGHADIIREAIDGAKSMG